MGSGTHLILVEFTDPSGQKKRLYEFIEVRASEKKSDVNIQEHRSEISRTKQDDVALAAKSETVTDFKNIPSSNHRALLGEQDKKK